MKRFLFITMLALAPLSVQAGDPMALEESEIDKATRSMEEAAKNLTNILGLVLRSIPQYEMPLILPNGDILIRRVRSEDKAPAPEEPDNSKI